MAGKLKKGQKVFSRPRDDSYESFRDFIYGFVRALGGDTSFEGETEEDEQEMRRAYEAFLAARKKSGASKETKQ
jgi:hypothetical protein